MTALINNTVHIQVSAFDLITSGNLNKIVLSSPLTTMTLYFYQFYEDGQSFLINRCAIKHDYIHLFFPEERGFTFCISHIEEEMLISKSLSVPVNDVHASLDILHFSADIIGLFFCLFEQYYMHQILSRFVDLILHISGIMKMKWYKIPDIFAFYVLPHQEDNIVD